MTPTSAQAVYTHGMLAMLCSACYARGLQGQPRQMPWQQTLHVPVPVGLLQGVDVGQRHVVPDVAPQVPPDGHCCCTA